MIEITGITSQVRGGVTPRRYGSWAPDAKFPHDSWQVLRPVLDLTRKRATICLIAILAVPSTASADPEARARLGAGDGLSIVKSATEGSTASVTATTGWDDARHAASTMIAADGRVGHGISVLAGASAEPGGRWRPYAGARINVLSSETQPVDLAFSLAYKAEGFTEPDGELELVASVGRRFGAAYVLLDGAYGQDPEGRDRDAEIGGAVMTSIGSIIASTTSRARYALGAKRDFQALWDVVADVGAAYPFGRYAARGAVGVSAMRTSTIVAGPLATISLSAFF
jgi:hypothetical protein